MAALQKSKSEPGFQDQWNRCKSNKYTVPYMVDLARNLILNPLYCFPAAVAVLLVESVLCWLIIQEVKYTEIDWSTYMQQVECYINGTRDYSRIAGDTGQIPYPAGHLFIYQFLRFCTNEGRSIRTGQYIFAVLYLANLTLVFDLYRKTKFIPPYVFLFTSLVAYRIHSIYVLRLFNDPIAMLLLYLAVFLWLREFWTLGCLIFSVAVTVKMNVLLFAPGLAFILLCRCGYLKSIWCLFHFLWPQILIGAPFLMHDWKTYTGIAFNLGRVFFYKWTVNFRFLPEWLFLDKRFHISLLVTHLLILLIFMYWRWLRPHYNGIVELLTSGKRVRFSENEMLFVLFSTNFVGVAFARSLHYQFYVWYFHSLPILLWSTRLPSLLNLLIMGAIEFSWNVYPSTTQSSLTLQFAHLLILVAIFCLKKADLGEKVKVS